MILRGGGHVHQEVGQLGLKMKVFPPSTCAVLQTARGAQGFD